MATRLFSHLHNPFASRTASLARPAETEGASPRPRTQLKNLFNDKLPDHTPGYCVGNGTAANEKEVSATLASDLIKWEKAGADIDFFALSQMKALEWERSNYDKIPPAERLLQNVPQAAYHEHVLRLALKAVGEEDTDAVLDSFKQAGLGTMHRQSGNAVSTVNGVLSGAANMAPEIQTKLALYALRIPVTLLNTYLNVSAADQKMWMDAWRELAPLIRMDPPGIKDENAPNPSGASYAVLSELGDWKKTLQKTEAAVDRFEQARARHEAHPHDAALKAQYEEGRRELQLRLGKLTHLLMVRMHQKTYGEGVKIDLLGNKRAFLHGYGSTWAVTLAAWGLLLSPVVGTTPPGAVMIGIALLMQGLQLRYQCSDGPSKDGEDYLKRAFIFFAKSQHVLMETCAERYKQIDAAYCEYEKELKRLPKFPLANEQTEDKRKQIEDAYHDKVQKILSDPDDHVGTTERENWQLCRDHVRQKETLAASQAATPQLDGELREMDRKFAEAQKKNFNTKTISASYKNATGDRRQKGERLLSGKVAALQREAVALLPSFTDPSSPPDLRTLRKQKLLRNKLEDSLFDDFNLELAKQRVAQAATKGLSPDAQAACSRSAAACLDAIRDREFWDLFCGDATAQAKAGAKSKALMAGELIGRRIAFAANTAITSTVSLVLAGVGEARLDAAANGHTVPRYNDQNFSSFVAPATAHSQSVVTYERGAFNEKAFKSAQQAFKTTGGTAVPGPPGLEEVEFFDRDNPAHRALIAGMVDQLLLNGRVPERISMLAPAKDGDSTDAAKPLLSLDLTKTSGYAKDAFSQASLKKKARFAGSLAKTALAYTGSTVVAVPLYGIAKFPMHRTRHSTPLDGHAPQDVQKRSVNALKAASMSDALDDALAHFLSSHNDPASGRFAASLKAHVSRQLAGDGAYPLALPEEGLQDDPVSPQTAFRLDDFGVAKRGMRGADSLLHALVGKPLSPPAAAAMREELADVIRREADTPAGNALNARELALSLGRMAEADADDGAARIADLVRRRPISNEVYADFVAIAGAHANGRREIAAWSRLPGNHALAIVVDSSDNTITAYGDGAEMRLTRHQYDEALKNGDITANDVVLWKTAEQWQQVDISGKLGSLKAPLDALPSDTKPPPDKKVPPLPAPKPTALAGRPLSPDRKRQAVTPPQVPPRPMRKPAVTIPTIVVTPPAPPVPPRPTLKNKGKVTPAATTSGKVPPIVPAPPVKSSPVTATPSTLAGHEEAFRFFSKEIAQYYGVAPEELAPMPVASSSSAPSTFSPTGEQGKQVMRRMATAMAQMNAPFQAYLANHGMSAAPNSGSGLNCYIIALLQHATGQYDQQFTQEAQAIRLALNIQPGMLYSDNGIAERIAKHINARYGTNLVPYIISATRVSETSDEVAPVFTYLPENIGEGTPVAVWLQGNHYEAVVPTALLQKKPT